MFRDLIESRCGLHFDESQRASLSASLSARMHQLGLVELDDYYDRLCSTAASGGPGVDDEFRKLVNLVTVTETCFLRDIAQFRMLRHRILPALFADPDRRAARSLRIWSAGCSSGEEAYSIALTLWDMGVYLGYPDWTFEIVGTDLNTQVLEQARRGVYQARALRNVEGDWLERFFTREGDGFHLNDEIRRCVRFHDGNLTQTPARPASQDIVFCKNVAIYFRSDVARQLVHELHEIIAPGGYLLLGHSESLWHVSDAFSLVEHDHAYCYQKIAAGAKKGSGGFFEERRAEKPSRSLLAARPPAAPDLYAQCLRAFHVGDWTVAQASLEGLVRSCPTFVPAYLLLGGIYADRGRYDDAVAQAACVLRLSDLEPRAHLLLGMIAARRGRTEDALQSLRRALYLDDSLALAHFWLGNLYRDRGDIARACHEYENVVRDWERRTLEMTEEFASELSPEQLVDYCSDSLQRLRGAAYAAR